ncbi:ATP-dependent zinc protease [Verrucomicrobiaceae bacterium 227]
MTPESQDLLTIGWREWVALPELGITAIKAKIDSGARTSCLHTAEYAIFQKDGADWVRFTVHPIKKHDEVETHAEAQVVDYRIVRDSGGHEEKRPFIRTNLHIGKEIWSIEVSLSNRENMKFRMLLGRAGMAQRALIDCSKSYLTKSKPRTKKS